MDKLICIIAIPLALTISILKIFRIYLKDEKITRKLNKLSGFLNVISIMILIYIVAFVDLSALWKGNSSFSKIAISENKFEISYKTSSRDYSNRVEFDKEKGVKVISTCTEGKVYLRIAQGTIEKIHDITNYDDYIDMSSFKDGYINLRTYNEKARNVELKVLF